MVHCSALVPYHVDDLILEAHGRGMDASLEADDLDAAGHDVMVIVALPVRPLT